METHEDNLASHRCTVRKVKTLWTPLKGFRTWGVIRAPSPKSQHSTHSCSTGKQTGWLEKDVGQITSPLWASVFSLRGLNVLLHVRWLEQGQAHRSAQFNCSVVSDSLWPHGLQHTTPPCSSPTPGAYSNSRPLRRWCHPTILSSVVLFSSCLQSPSFRVFFSELFLCIK